MLIMLNRPLREINIEHPTLGDITLCLDMPLEYQSSAWEMASEKACSECDLGNTCDNNCEFYEYSLMRQLKRE